MTKTEESLIRVLIVDDNTAIHEDFRKVLAPPVKNETLEKTEELLFGTPSTNSDQNRVNYRLSFASQGQEAYQKVNKSIEEKDPFSVAFVDMRMPPGWDGMNTIEKIWEVDPRIQVVICSAYSDYSWNEVLERVGHNDNLLILKKPFDSAEVSQMTAALAKKWRTLRFLNETTRDMEEEIRELFSVATQILGSLEEPVKKVEALLGKETLEEAQLEELREGAKAIREVIEASQKTLDDL